MIAFLRSLPGTLTALCGIALVVSLVPGMELAAYAAVAFGAYGAVRSAAESLQAREIDVNLLMVLAAIGAIAVGHPDDAGILLFLFSLSGALEELAMSRTKNAIEGLVKLRPSEAIRVLDTGEERVRVEELKFGNRVRVSPFEPIPVDGTVMEGSSAVDQSSMTGEAHDVPVKVGSRVIGGTRNLDGSFVMQVETTVGDSTLDKIVALVQDAQDNKASGERISAWFGQRYTIFVLVVFGLSLAVRTALGQAIGFAFYESLTLLVALSPCALVISTPASTLSALAYGARRGILIRGGEFIELAGQVDTLALDKTGTLTEGRPKLVEICVCAPVGFATGRGVSCTDEGACWSGSGPLSPDAAEFLRFAAAVEAHSAHPVALALRQAAESNGLEVPLVAEERTLPGLGLTGRVDGTFVAIGQLRLFQDLKVETPAEFVAHAKDLEVRGLTVALLAVGDRLAALGFADEPRADAADFLASARKAGVKKILMLTGDTQATASAVASRLDVDEVHAALLPQDKTRLVGELSDRGHRVMMVGDGVNDAPALAKASVGVAMGGLGSDIAMNAADVVLMHDRLANVPDLIHLGRQTVAVIRANLLFASGVIIALTVTSLIGKLPLPIAVLGHEGSTVLVILNGLRLLRGPKTAT